jgi:hypothetical protein
LRSKSKSACKKIDEVDVTKTWWNKISGLIFKGSKVDCSGFVSDGLAQLLAHSSNSNQFSHF